MGALVTGVQTCALPICWKSRGVSSIHAIITDSNGISLRIKISGSAGETSSFCGPSTFHGSCENDFFPPRSRSEEHTSELQSLMRISYAVFCLKKKKNRPVREHN